ncbi:alpha/beta hydrolase [Marinobacter salinexigens]|uniref:Alpha/beta hydrolase n=1 Tax=Marinobacter salinexigens TaxID=2919747 RepID=A0A5B0VFD5_9GAMM|nr:alpha/beta fold hydrolase [Marinobacter salinexigens]KAA1173347.1 alpha/beta hydrolase [Marinobacter salinexigens]
MSLSLNVFQTAFGTYSRLLPSHAAARAVKLMTSPRISAERRQSSRALFDDVVVLKGDALLSMYGRGQKTMLVLHGWSGWIGQFNDLLSEVDPNEYTVYALHPLGHGESKAAESHPGRFIEAVMDAHDHVGRSFDVAIGHSLGAAALIYVEAVQPCFERLVLVSGPATIEGVLNRFARFVNLGEKSRRLFIRNMEMKVGLDIDRLDLLSLAPSISKPTLLVHDERDREIPVDEAGSLNQVFPKSRLVRTAGYGHSRLLQRPEVIQEILEFIAVSQRR